MVCPRLPCSPFSALSAPQERTASDPPLALLLPVEHPHRDRLLTCKPHGSEIESYQPRLCSEVSNTSPTLSQDLPGTGPQPAPAWSEPLACHGLPARNTSRVQQW